MNDTDYFDQLEVPDDQDWLDDQPGDNLPLPEDAKTYALVAVDTRNRVEPLTYAIPASLQASIQPGQLAWVPVRDERVQGIVLDITSQPPTDFKVRPLIDLVDSQPWLWNYQLQLGQWLSHYYFSGLFEALSLMLPPGLARTAKPTLSRTAAGSEFLLPPGLNSNQLFLLDLLREKEPPPESDKHPPFTSELKKLYVVRHGKTTFEKTVKALEQAGLVQSGFYLPRPGVKPQLKPFVRLAPYLQELPENDASLIEKLGRSKRLQAVFNYLRTELESGYLLPAEEVCLAAETNLATLRTLAAKGLLEIEEREVRRDPLANRPQRTRAEEAPALTYRQSQVWRTLHDSFDEPGAHTYLLHGVTGSGKTEIYLRAIARMLKEGKQAIVLVPEIALTTQIVDRFAARFPGKIAVRHSRLSTGEAYDEWRRIRDGSAQIVIGPRSALFSPLPNPGLIIMDEEHEWSYKQDEAFGGLPLYHARRTAEELCQLTGAKLILGSATPAIDSYLRAEQGIYTLLSLPDRVSAQPTTDGEGPARASAEPLPLPPVETIDLRNELKAGNSSIFSRSLQRSLAETLAAKRQAILFLNRRGTATIVMCRDCGAVVVCEDCETPLVWHADLDRLVCHRCGKRWVTPRQCPACHSDRIRHFGVGTKRVEEELHKLFPAARILRWDQDTIAGGGPEAYQQLYDQMANHEADLLVGTQMIAKGLDLPYVALVGVITADTGLHLPDIRSAERTFQLLTQVVGRAGRRLEPGTAIVQSYTPEHYAIETAARHHYLDFYQQEIAFRQQHDYPPFASLIKFSYSHKDEAHARLEAEITVKELLIRFADANIEAEDGLFSFIGPAPAFNRKLRGLYRYQFILRINGSGLPGDPNNHPQQEAAIREIIRQMRPQMHGWQVDVDPQSLL